MSVTLFISKNSGKGSLVIFDYTSPDVIDGTHESVEAQGWLKIAENSNEPIFFGIQHGHVEQLLTERGFSKIFIATNKYFNDNYYTAQNNFRTATPIFSIVHAEVVN